MCDITVNMIVIVFLSLLCLGIVAETIINVVKIIKREECKLCNIDREDKEE